MNDIYRQIISYAMSVWRRRWYVLLVGWFICAGGWVLVAGLPDRYESSARIYVDMDTMLGPLMRGIAVETDLFHQIDIMQRTLFSRPNLEKVILMTDLDLSINTPLEKESLLADLKSNLELTQQGRNLFEVTFGDSDPDTAKRVVQAVLAIFVESNLGASRKDMDTTRRFLRQQTDEYERQLTGAEERLANFKKEKMGFLPGGGNYYQHMQKVRGELDQTRRNLEQAGTLRDQLRAELKKIPRFHSMSRGSGRMALSAPGSPGPDSPMQLRVFELEQTLDRLLMHYTPQHPDVAVTQKRLDQLRETMKKEEEAALAQFAQRDGEEESVDENIDTEDRVSNPVYEQVKLKLIQHEAAVAVLTRRANAQEIEVKKWADLAQIVPQVEAELARLTRDYEIVKQSYGQLRQRQESANLAENLETTAKKIQFRIIDPPRVPISPSGPNRILFLTAVLVMGIGAGVAFAFLIGQINNSFVDAVRLKTAVPYPIFGTVSAVVSVTERRRRRREMLTFGFVAFGLILAYSGLVTVEMMNAEFLALVGEKLRGLVGGIVA